jgi:hypothetical protein
MTATPLQQITAEIHARFWDLPAQIDQRKKRKRDAYRNRYMREVYRKAHPRLDVTLSQAQYRHLEQAARQSGRPVTAYLREAAFAYLERRYLVPRDIDESLHALVYQLRAAGNNLNQIAHHANTKRRATADDVRQARKLLVRMETAVTGFVRRPPLSEHG